MVVQPGPAARQLAPVKVFEISDVDARVTESNNTWWRFAWRLTLKSVDTHPHTMNATIEFQDKDGFIIDKDNEYNLHLLGARVIAGASTAEKLAVAREHGADDLVNYATENLTERVMALTGDKGADVCFDPVGGELADAALSALGWGGRMLLVGFVGGVQQIPANRLLLKNRSALGCSLRYYRWHAPDKLHRSVAALLAWYGEGKLKPCISHRLPLEKSVEAITLLTARQAHGKVVVLPGLR